MSIEAKGPELDALGDLIMVWVKDTATANQFNDAIVEAYRRGEKAAKAQALKDLETYFPWLRVNAERQQSGADTIDQLAELHRDFGGVVSDPTDECDNCGAEWLRDELDEITDYSERVEDGEAEPTGECPSCGCLCHPMEGAK